MKFLILITLFFSFNIFANDPGKVPSFNYDKFASIGILAEGRVKPLDTFARANLLMVFEKSKLKDMSAIEWFAELLFAPEKSYYRRIFKIRNSDVIKALNITANKTHNYNFMEVSAAINNERALVGEISKIDKKERTPSQNQIYELYFKVSNIYEISRSLTLITPRFTFSNKEFAKKLNLPHNQRMSYLQIQKKRGQFFAAVRDIMKKGDFTPYEFEVIEMGRKLENTANDSFSRILRIVPPQFNKTLEKEWLSPWQTVQQGEGNPLTVKYFKLWGQLYSAYHDKDIDAWEEVSGLTKDFSLKLSHGLASKTKLDWEIRYSKWDLFTKSVAFYILSFLLLCASWLFWTKKLQVTALTALAVGTVTHFFGLAIRCYVMSRPPVSTLYESVIFVAFVCVVGSLLFELKNKKTLGTFVGSCLGAILLFVSFSYEKDGDSMGMLAAVLDTNFWLATHVVTITIGYGCCFVASLLAHVYLFQRILKEKFSVKKDFDSKTVVKNMLGATLFSLFFTVLGTILGGIWADQSWGRFWGWDPKENGAMLICMWLLWAVHGRLTKYFNDLGFAVTVAYTSVIVVLAWFGVNLLNVGLHSYGFTDSIANNIAMFTIAETLICLSALVLLKVKVKVQ